MTICSSRRCIFLLQLVAAGSIDLDKTILAEEDACARQDVSCGVEFLQKQHAQAHVQSQSAAANFKFPLKVLLINLDSRPDRWEKMLNKTASLRKAGVLDVERLSASGAAEEAIPEKYVSLVFNKTRTGALVNDLLGVRLPKSSYAGPDDLLNRGERGIDMSNLRAWQKIISNDAPALILEDDIAFDDNVADILKDLQQASFSESPDGVWLEYRTVSDGFPGGQKIQTQYVPGHGPRSKKPKKFSELSWVAGTNQTLPSGSIVQQPSFIMGSGAYILWPSGAKKLTAQAPIDGCIDGWLASNMHFGKLRAAAVIPQPMTQDHAEEEGAASDIGGSYDHMWQLSMQMTALGQLALKDMFHR